MFNKRREEFRILPIDTKKNVAVGIGLPFNAKGIFKLNYTTAEQVKSNLINLLLTNMGERPFNPEFGGNLRSLLFEQNIELDYLQDFISNKISRYIPDVNLLSVNMTKQDDNNSIKISINYSVNNQQDNAIILVQ